VSVTVSQAAVVAGEDSTTRAIVFHAVDAALAGAARKGILPVNV
jgi:hypothetical protein